MSEVRVTLRDLEIAILEVALERGTASSHRSSFIGLPYSPGLVEQRLGLSFSPAERRLAYRAIDSLADRDLLVRTYTNPSDLDHWFSASPGANVALESGLLALILH